MAYNPNSIWKSPSERKEEAHSASSKPAEPSRAPVPAIPAAPSAAAKAASALASLPVKKGLTWFGAAIVVLFLALMIGLYLMAPKGDANLDIQFSKPDQILAGSPFTVAVSFANNSDKTLAAASISLALPEDVAVVGEDPGNREAQQSLGDIAPRAVTVQDFNLIATGGPDSVKHLTARVAYTVGKNQFENSGNLDFPVGDAAAAFSIDAPQGVWSGRDFALTVRYANNSDADMANAKVVMQFPPAFTMASSSIGPLVGQSNTWGIGTLAAGASGSFTITGKVSGQPKAIYPFAGNIVAQYEGYEYTVGAKTVDIAAASMPLELSVTANGSSSFVAQPGTSLSYTLQFVNHSNATLRNLTVHAALVGTMFNFPQLQSEGALDSVNNTILWNTGNTPGLASLPPGGSGSVSFSVPVKAAYAMASSGDKDLTLTVNGDVESPTVPAGTTASGTAATAVAKGKVGGALALAATGYHVDPEGGPKNAGPYPPKVNQPTEYTIHWKVKNYATDVSSVKVWAYLQSGSSLIGSITANTSSVPQYDPGSGLIEWDIPMIPAGTGVFGAPLEATFRVTNTPAINQVNRSAVLIGPSTIRGTDEFTGATLQVSADAVTTQIPADTSVSGSDRQITQ